jgi:hypothetical protein
MMDHSTTSAGRGHRAWWRITATAAAGVLAAACGSSTAGSGATATTATTAQTATTAVALTSVTSVTSVASPSTPPPSGDAAVVAASLLVPDDLGQGWHDVSANLSFPNSADLARTVPACAPYVDLVFNGGAHHGVGRSAAFGDDTGKLVFTYVVVFASSSAAAKMVTAVGTPGFDACWAAFNGAGVPTMPLGVTKASYHSVTPPTLTVTSDSLAVKALEGTVTMGGNELPDTCVCAFAQVGRAVVEVHSVAEAYSPADRSALVQKAVDKLKAELAKG